MENVTDELHGLLAEIQQVRRSIMADAPRRVTYQQAVDAQDRIEHLLGEFERTSDTGFRMAAE